jgi:hypothetical protein
MRRRHYTGRYIVFIHYLRTLRNVQHQVSQAFTRTAECNMEHIIELSISEHPERLGESRQKFAGQLNLRVEEV